MFLELMMSKINVVVKRTSQIMTYGQDVIIQKWTDDNIQYGIGTRCSRKSQHTLPHA